MSGELVIATVSSLLKNLLASGLVNRSSITGISDVGVSALPPDQIAGGAEGRDQVNVFLYRVSPHLTTRNGSAGKEAPGDLRTARLALDLSYLVTVHSGQDLHSEILLGCIMDLFRSSPVLSRERIKETLNSQTANMIDGSTAANTLATWDPESQLHEIKISPQFLSFEEMSKLWSVLQLKYRVSMVYQVSTVVLAGR